jgi:hypothetical protein
VADLESRLLNRSVDKCDDRVALSEFFAADMAFHGPFRERSQFYFVYFFSQLIIGLLSSEFFHTLGVLPLVWNPARVLQHAGILVEYPNGTGCSITSLTPLLIVLTGSKGKL